MSALRGQTVLVLGGSSGIGRAVAAAAAARGATTIAISRSGAAPDGARGIALDLTDRPALAQHLRDLPAIDHLVHTAGARFGATPLATMPDGFLEQAFATKLFSAIGAVRLALPHLAPAASITLTSGQLSRKYGVGTLAKGAINAAVEAAGKHLAKELAPRRVNVVSPGVIDTDAWGETGTASRTTAIERATSLAVQRIGTAEEVADAFLFAMMNRFVTGSVIDVDGGGLL